MLTIDVVLVPLLLTLNISHTFSKVSIVDFEQVSVCWEDNSKTACGFIAKFEQDKLGVKCF